MTLTPFESVEVEIALANLEKLADAMQKRLTHLPAPLATLPIGHVLSLSRNIDTLERVCFELSGMINPKDQTDQEVTT